MPNAIDENRRRSFYSAGLVTREIAVNSPGYVGLAPVHLKAISVQIELRAILAEVAACELLLIFKQMPVPGPELPLLGRSFCGCSGCEKSGRRPLDMIVRCNRLGQIGPPRPCHGKRRPGRPSRSHHVGDS